MKNKIALILIVSGITALIILFYSFKPKPIKRVQYLCYWLYTPTYTSMSDTTHGYHVMPEIYTVTLNDGYNNGDTIIISYRQYLPYGYDMYKIIQKVKMPVNLGIVAEQKM